MKNWLESEAEAKEEEEEEWLDYLLVLLLQLISELIIFFIIHITNFSLYGIIFYRGFDEVNPSIPSKTIE
jgi:ribonucleotide reductase beta subunit family protein with ferritin-like domain